MKKHNKLCAKLLSLALAMAMVVGALPGTAFALETDGISECHPAHDENCGYIAMAEGVPCAHLNDDGAYACAQAEADEAYACLHHDECEFAEAVDGVPCSHSCELCEMEDNSGGENSGAEPVSEPVFPEENKESVSAPRQAAFRAGEEITEPLDFTGTSTPASGAGYTWDSGSKTLTLSGISLNFTPTGTDQSAILVPIGSTVIVQDGTVNKVSYNGCNGYGDAYGAAIRSTAEDISQYITVTGQGSLELYLTGLYTSGINVMYGGLRIEDIPDLEVTSSGGTSTNEWCSAIATTGKTHISNSNITSVAAYKGISASPLIIDESTVSITTQIDTGVYVQGESLIKNSDVTINAKTYAWIQSTQGGVLTVDNSKVNTNVQTSQYSFYEWKGYETNGFIFKNGSIVKATGGTKAVRTLGDSFITFDNCEFYYSNVKITDYKTNVAFESKSINIAADYSGVDAAIEAANALNQDHYADFSGVEVAIGAVIRDKYDTEQDTVDGYATAIEDAIAALQYKGADYSKVDAAIAKIPSDLSIYTADSAKALNDATGAIVRGKNITEQAIVDDYATAIEEAIKALKYKDADYSKVDKAIAKIPSDLSSYSADSVKALNDAKDAVVRDKNITEQAIVDGYATAIEDAIKALKYKGADYTKVDAAIAKIPSDLSCYTVDSVKALNDAKDAVVRGKNITEQAIVDGYATAIEDALKALKYNEAAHTWNSGTVTTPPTHTQDGVKTYTCTVCGQTKTEVIPKLPSDSALVDNSTGIKVEYEDGTTFDSSIVLNVTSKPQAEMDKFKDNVDKVAPGLVLGGLYDVKLLKDGVAIQPDGKVKVSIPLTDKMKSMTNLQVVYIDDNGNVTIIPSEVKDGKIVFVTDHFSYYGVIGKVKASDPGNNNGGENNNSNNGNTNSPQTGDSSPVLLFVLMMLASGIALVILTQKRKIFKRCKK